MKKLLKLGAQIGVLAFALMSTSGTFAQERASLRLNWLYYGFHSFFPLGVDKGFYKDEGIDLTIGEGKGSGSPYRLWEPSRTPSACLTEAARSLV